MRTTQISMRSYHLFVELLLIENCLYRRAHARMENVVYMAYTLAHHEGLQVLSICAGALSGARHVPR